MASPVAGPYGTALLDNFNRSNETPIATNWSGPVQPGDPQLNLSSNQITPNPSSAGHSWYDVTTFPADQEAWCEMVNDLDGSGYGVELRISEPNTTNNDQYRVENSIVAGGANDLVKIGKVVNNSYTQLGASITQEWAAGDSIAGVCIGDRIEAWRWDGSSWALLGSRTDSSVPGGGFIGCLIIGATCIMDNFGGGAIGSTWPGSGAKSQVERARG